MTAHESIHYIRAKRPGSVQMTKQIEGSSRTNSSLLVFVSFDLAVEEYERFLLPKRRVFTDWFVSVPRLFPLTFDFSL